jgi:hypothetical protein
MPRDFLMETLEGMEHGLKGDFLAQNPVDGEQWPIARKVFQSMYELAPVQTLVCHVLFAILSHPSLTVPLRLFLVTEQ